jgi:MFS family permease
LVPKGPVERHPSPSRRSLQGLDWFVFFLGDIQTGFGPFISIYLVTQKWTQTDIGLVLTLGALAGLICQIPGGALIDGVRSERSAAAVAVVFIGISASVIAAWPIFMAVAVARVLHAAASAVLGPAIAAITLGLVGRRAIAERFGRNARFASAGNGAAAVLMGACGHFISPQSVFIVTAVFALPTLAALYRIRADEISVANAHGAVPESSPSKGMRGIGQLLRKRALWIFVCCIALFQLANTPMLPLVGSALTVRSGDWAVSLVAACVVVPQILVALCSPWVGRLAHGWGRRPLLLIGFAALPIRGILFAYSSDPIMLVAVQLLDGVSAAVVGVLVPLVLSDISFGTGRFNLAQGATGTAIGLAAAFSTTAAGYVTDSFGSRAAFLGLAGTAAFGFLLLALLMPETRPSDE